MVLSVKDDSLRRLTPKNLALTALTISKALVRQATLKKILSHPLVWVALGVHALLLVVPYNPAPAPVVEEEPEEIDESIPVDILNLSALSTPTPPPVKPPPAATPPTPNTPPPAAPPPVAAAPPVAAPPVNPVPVPNTPPPAGEPPAGEPPAGDPPVGDPPAGDPPAGDPPAYDPNGDRNLVIQGLGSFGADDVTQQSGFPLPSFFRKGNAESFLPGGQPPATALDVRWMNIKPDQVLATLETTYQSAQLSFIPVAPYGDELLYEVQTVEGQIAMYVSLVDLKASTLLVMWPELPQQ